MNPITEPSSVAQKIARTEAAIDSSNARLHALRQDLGASARRTLRAKKKHLVIGGIAAVAVGLVAYRQRHAITRRVNALLDSPSVQTIVQRLPLIGLVLPLISSARHREGATPTSKWTALLSTGLPLLNRLFAPGIAGRRTSAH